MATVFVLSACGGSGLTFPSLPTDGSSGTFSASFQHDGVQREAIVYVPESYSSAEATPVLLNFHGYGDTATQFMESADLRPLADEDGFVLVYPQGTQLDKSPHWNSAAPSDDNKSDAEDFGYVELLIDTIAASYELDADRVYAAGYSNGGMMSFGVACYLSDRFAAVASVSGAMLDDIGVSCTPSHPTSVITLHGTDDSVLPYEGGDGMNSAEGVLDYWTELDGITTEPATGSTEDGGTLVESVVYTGGLAGTEVHHYRVVGGDHVWFDLEVDGADTNRLIWEFVSRFSRDGVL
jgi:polyhydroxybutyrate depolymerase